MFLVSTAEEASWNTGQRILFVGEWCRRYSRKHIWKPLDALVLPYHWSDREKFNSDYYYLSAVYENSLHQLSVELNRVHGLAVNIQYWRILVGPWLRFFIDTLFDRFEVIKAAGEAGAVHDSWVLPYELSEWVPNGFGEFYASLNDDKWNHIVFAECIHALGLPYSKLPVGLGITPNPRVTDRRGVTPGFIRRSLEVCGTLIPPRLNRCAIVSSYLPIGRLARLQIGLGQLPYLVAPLLTAPNAVVDSDIRNSVNLDIGNSQFERLLGKLLSIFLPKSYMESYSWLRKHAIERFPSNPHTIFTANAYQGDDGFKVWAAEMRLNGVPLIIGQHGGNMGLAHHNQTEDHQLRIADRFCSWGWLRQDATSISPMPSLQLSDSGLMPSPTGHILIVLASLPRYFYCHFSMPVAGEFLQYIDEQIQLVSGIKFAARNLVRIRLNGDEYGWDIEQRLEDAGLASLIDKTSEGLDLRLSKCRLCIVSYNATVILQTMAANFPTLAFWNPDFFDIRPEAIPLISRLREVGILHDTVESAAALLNVIHGNIEVWWTCRERQAVREEFCKTYARISSHWITDWSAYVDAVANSGTTN